MEKKFIKNVPLSKIIPFDRNPRRNDIAVDKLVESIKRVGNNDPIEVNEDYVILCGHTRLKALKKLEYKKTDIIMISGLTKKQQNEYRITNNKIGELAEWDFEILEADFKSEKLTEFGFGNDIDFDKIKSNENREKKFKEQTVSCPHCDKTFKVLV